MAAGDALNLPCFEAGMLVHLIPPHIDDLIHGQISLRHWAATRSALFERARERPVECVCECLFLARSIGRVATRVDTGRP